MAIDPVPVTALQQSTAATLAWRCNNQLYLTVVVKATFAFAVDAPMTRTKPQQIVRAEVHHGQNPARSVLLTSDLAPYLPRADVLFTGNVYAPSGVPTPSLPLRLAVFSSKGPVLDKRLVAQDPAGFQRLPVVYENALRGIDDENPLGVTSNPNILDPRNPDRPGGFGPLGRAWPLRKRLLGTTPRATLDEPLATFPDDFDWTYFQAAPPDQRIDFLGGNEWLLLEGLHPSVHCLRTRLPGARGLARLYGLDEHGISEGTLLELVADTLRIDGEALCCTVVWRQNVPIAGENALNAANVVAGVEVADEMFEWPETPPALPTRPPPSPAPSSRQTKPHLQETIALSPEAAETAADRAELPFAKRPSVLPVTPSSELYGDGFLAVEHLAFESPRPAPVPPPILGPIAPPLGLRAASDAAAAVMEIQGDTSPETIAETTGPQQAVDLVWFDPRSMPRIRKQPAWRAILEELTDEAIDPEIDDPDLHVDPAAAEERRDVFEVLVKAEPTSSEDLRNRFQNAVRRDGRFVAPVVLVAGEMSLPFDEFAMLEATIAVVDPFVGTDEGLKAALGAGREFLSARGSLSSRVTASKLSAAIKVAYEQGKRAVSIDDVVEHIEQGLLDERRYQRRAVLGGKMLRGLVQWDAASEPMPVYLPEVLADMMPMFRRFEVRLIGEMVMAVDQREKQAMALRVLAFARVGVVEGW